MKKSWRINNSEREIILAVTKRSSLILHLLRHNNILFTIKDRIEGKHNRGCPWLIYMDDINKDNRCTTYEEVKTPAAFLRHCAHFFCYCVVCIFNITFSIQYQIWNDLTTHLHYYFYKYLTSALSFYNRN